MPYAWPRGAEFHEVDIAADHDGGGDGAGHPPGALGKTGEDELRRQHRGCRGFQRRQGVRAAPGFAEKPHEKSIPVGVERRLGKAEVQVGAHASLDELRREQVEPFVIGEGQGLRVPHQPRRHRRPDSVQPEARGPAAFRIDGLFRCTLVRL
jgi:hypothetical protein